MAITTHAPWQIPPIMVNDISQLSGDSDAPTLPNYPRQGNELESQRLSDYMTTVSYEWDVLSDFLVRHAKRDFIAVVIGDHQPFIAPRGKADEYYTPVHLISNRPEWIEPGQSFGFRPGFQVGQNAEPIHHSGFFSLLVGLLRPGLKTAYYPTGVETKALGI